MKKLLTLIILALPWSNVGSAEDYEWKISTISDGQTVLARMNGNVTHGNTLMFSLKNNQGKCDYVKKMFTFYTMSKNPDIKKIEGKIIPIKFNEDNTYAEASYVQPFMFGHRVIFSTGSYKVNEYLDYMLKYETYAVTIEDETNPKSSEQFNMIENFKAYDYFEIPNAESIYNRWNVKNAKEAILKAQKLCLEYKETEKNITESKQVTKTYADGTIYVGEIKNGVPNGQGIFIYPDGSKYVGEWKKGEKIGQGTLTLVDGTRYNGSAEDNKPERNVIESDFQNAWQIDNKFIIPECFHIIRFGGGSGAVWYKKFFDEYIEKPAGNHFKHPKFKNFIINIGEYLNKEVPLNHSIKTNWTDHKPPEISISQNLEECLSKNPETKITPSPSGLTLEYKVVETFDVNIGKELAPHINEIFESIKKVEIQTWGGGTLPPQSHENIYGILKVDGKKIILPLKNDLIINKTR